MRQISTVGNSHKKPPSRPVTRPTPARVMPTMAVSKPMRRRSWIGRRIGFDTGIVGITLAGVGLVTARLGGLWWLLPTVLICLIWSTYNAWSLTIDAIDRHQDKTP